ncbi:TIGR03016 family PEP-CTERM system-associated outer membrane protein [Rhizobacter fulvus]
MDPRRSRLVCEAVAIAWGSVLPVAMVHAQLTLPAEGEARQSPPAILEVSSQIGATDNGRLDPKGQERSDVILSVRPQLRMSRRSAAMKFDLDAAVTLFGYTNGSQQGGAVPDLRASLQSTLVDRWLYLDARAHIRQSEADEFGTRAYQGSDVNRRIEGIYQISPYVNREIAPNTTVLVRHDLGLTIHAAGNSARLVTNQSLARIERKPTPIGGSLELSRLDTETRRETRNRFTLESGRAQGNLALAEDVVLGAIVGVDRSRFSGSDYTDTRYGAAVQWNPSPRTELAGELEHRFFGSSGNVVLRHRTPSMSFSLSASRQPVLVTSSFGMRSGADIRNFLDAILTTRFPDPATRQGVVDQVVNSRGLDTRSAGAVNIIANYPQLVTSVQVDWTWLSARNAASVILYANTGTQLSRDGDPLTSLTPSKTDTRQSGGSVQFSRRLTPQLSANLFGRWSTVKGLAAREGDVSDERTVRLSLQQALSPRTSVSAGVGHTRFRTTVAYLHDYGATLAFVGMSHRF